ncbi:MAG: hypothetical protein HDR72_02470 [Ruminococcaceae bacterium]|nr:hypothetical protein [Oscillospiraceae bacterium]
MPRKEKALPHDPHEPHGKPPREEKPKRRRRRFPVILFLLLLLAVIIALLIVLKPFGGNGFGVGGNGNNVNSGDGQSSGSVSDSIPESDSSQSNIAVIRIDGNDIFLDGEQCENAAALKDKITTLGTKKDYELDHSAAIKSTYDEVKQVLSELENALDIKVNYNE